MRISDWSSDVCSSDLNRVQLTPVAIREGQAFADTLFGDKPTRVDYESIPSAVFSHPPLAGVGLTEGQARDRLGSVKTYPSDFRPMKNVLAGRRSAEPRGGKECVRTVKSRGGPYHTKKKK